MILAALVSVYSCHKTNWGACFHANNPSTHCDSVRGWLTHLLSSLLPKGVRVWSNTHSRLPFRPPSVCRQKSTNPKDLQPDWLKPDDL